MKHWDDTEKAEFEAAVDEAWNSGRNTTERIDAFIRIVTDGEQAQRRWAKDVLQNAIRYGLGKQLKDERKSQQQMVVAFAGGKYKVSGIGAVVRITERGRVYEQMSFMDMTREQLVESQKVYESMAFALRRNKNTAKRFIELIDQTGAATAREAAELAHIDLKDYLAESA